jgi:hypothetical protein
VPPGQDQDPDEVLAFLRKIGSKSDKARAKKDDTETFDWNLLDWPPYRAVRAKRKATFREPARTSVSSPRTFAPLLTTEGLCILLTKAFKWERKCLMKLEIFIILLVANLPSGVSYVRGV